MLLVDDVLATGGTLRRRVALVEQAGGGRPAVSVVIELAALADASARTAHRPRSLDHLTGERPPGTRIGCPSGRPPG